MPTVNVTPKVRSEVLKKYGDRYSSLSGIAAAKIADDVLSEKKIHEQVAVLERAMGVPIRGKKVLDVGSGFGIFVTVAAKSYGADAYGVEPGGAEFDGSFEISEQILKDSGIDPARIRQGVGEALPYADNSFDIVYSTNVLEHVSDPAKVLSEAVRVAKPGGFIQIIFPSYGSFFDGHYACFYLPYQPKWLWKLWVKHWLGRDPSYVDTLRTELNYWSARRMLRAFGDAVELIDTGEGVFKDRMLSIDITPYAGLGRVKKVVDFLRRAGIARLVAAGLLLIKAHSPIILSIRKKPH